MFRKTLDYAEAGDNVGTLLRGVDRTAWSADSSREARLYPSAHQVSWPGICPDQEEGGRHTPFFGNYRPQFYFRTTDVTGVVQLPEGVEMCMPGDHITMSVD
jgi:elongation factor Tu